MGYEILDDDLYNDSKKDKKSFFKKDIKHKKEKNKLNPFLKYKLIFLAIAIFLFFISSFFGFVINIDKQFFFSDNNFYLEAEKIDNIQNYNGDLLIETDYGFLIEIGNTKFTSKDSEILLKNFNGSFRLSEGFFFIEGLSENINYGDNNIKLINDEKIYLTFREDVVIKTKFDILKLNLEGKGNLYFKDNIDYYFKEDSTINLKDFNGDFIFNKDKIKLIGSIKNFEFSTFDNLSNILEINYK